MMHLHGLDDVVRALCVVDEVVLVPLHAGAGWALWLAGHPATCRQGTVKALAATPLHP